MSIFSRLTGLLPTRTVTKTVPRDRYLASYYNPGSASYADMNGDKFFGGFGETKIWNADYWTLRARSEQLFAENLYASGIIRRLVTHEINTGLSLEAAPLRTILKLSDDYLEDWCERVEDLYRVWEWNKDLCDYSRNRVYGQVVCDIRTEALITGDILVVLRRNREGLPCIQTISGKLINTPMDKFGNPFVRHGVELNSAGEQIAYYVKQNDGSYKRLAARTADGTRVAWLVYGSPKRMDSVRGLPLLTIILQSLKEIDRYRDAAQRKAVLSSMLAIFIKKTHSNQMGTMPLGGSAVRKDSVTSVDADGAPRTFNLNSFLPGTILDDLAPGEEPQGFGSDATDLDFPKFEEAVLSAIAWSLEIPPSKMMMAYSSNYSASQAEINDFKTYLNKARTFIAVDLYQPVYEEFLYSLVLLGKIEAAGFLESRGVKGKFDTYGAWVYADWPGVVQPSTDILKTTKAMVEQINNGLTTMRRASRELNGSSVNDNLRQLLREQTRMADIRKFMTKDNGGYDNDPDTDNSDE